MIVFACQQCGKRFARPEATSGSVLFCACGKSNVVPWESTLPASEMPAETVPPRGSEQRPSYPIPPTSWRALEGPDRVVRQRNPSYCFNHQDTPPQYTCGECGEKFCADCVVVIESRALCGPCKNWQMRNKQRPPQVSVMAILAPIIALVTGPGAIFVIFLVAGVAAEGRKRTGGAGAVTGLVVIIGLLALGVQLAALTMSAFALRHTETNARVSGRALAITGVIAAVVWAILAGDVAVLMLHSVE